VKVTGVSDPFSPSCIPDTTWLGVPAGTPLVIGPRYLLWNDEAGRVTRDPPKAEEYRSALDLPSVREMLEQMHGLRLLTNFVRHRSSNGARKDDHRLRGRFDPCHAVVGDYGGQRRGDRLALGDIQVRPQPGRPRDQREVAGVSREHRVRRVRQAPLDDRVEELLPLRREPLG
jgi:hypothetical protein